MIENDRKKQSKRDRWVWKEKGGVTVVDMRRRMSTCE